MQKKIENPETLKQWDELRIKYGLFGKVIEACVRQVERGVFDRTVLTLEHDAVHPERQNDRVRLRLVFEANGEKTPNRADRAYVMAGRADERYSPFDARGMRFERK